MAALVLLRNPLTPHTREQYPLAAGTPVIDWLQEHHPEGFGMPIRFYVNGTEKPVDDLDYQVTDDDVVAIALMPAEPATLTAIAISIALSAVLSVGTYFAMRAFMPREQKSDGPSSIFDVASDQNAARIGDPIPVVYGNVVFSPDYVSQPFTWYEWSQDNYNSMYSGEQYLAMLMCIGQGDVDVTNIYVGDTDVSTIEDGVVQYRVFRPHQHKQTMGIISTTMGGGFHENVVTSSEVSSQEFVDAGESAGPFAVCKPGTKGSKFEIDITFPGGQTNPDSDGDIRGRETYFTVYFNELDANDNNIGTVYSRQIKASTDNDTSVTGPDYTTIQTTGEKEKNKTVITSPIRRSYMITAPKSARWAVKIVRDTKAPNAKNGNDRFLWTGLKLYADYQTTPTYGDVTLLAVRIKASKGLGNDAATRIRVRAKRRLSPPAGGDEVLSTSGADAFADVYTNSIYGAARPPNELDIALLTSLRSKWAGYGFNYAFRSRTTVWEALRAITTPFGAEPLPIGAVMSVSQDGVKPMRSALFTEVNIVAGSMSVQYSFDNEGAADGVEIEYTDPLDFRPSYSVYPASAVRPDRFTVPGIADATHAAQYARLTWNRMQKQRKRISFDTELEGLTLQMGDLIGVQHNTPKWGVGGQVLGYSGNILTVDKNLTWAGGSTFMLLRRPDGSVTELYSVSRGSRGNEVVVAIPEIAGVNPLPPINVDNAYEYTSYAFGSITSIVRDFIVISTKPNGDNTVTIEAVKYDDDVYIGAMSFMVM